VDTTTGFGRKKQSEPPAPVPAKVAESAVATSSDPPNPAAAAAGSAAGLKADTTATDTTIKSTPAPAHTASDGGTPQRPPRGPITNWAELDGDVSDDNELDRVRVPASDGALGAADTDGVAHKAIPDSKRKPAGATIKAARGAVGDDEDGHDEDDHDADTASSNSAEELDRYDLLDSSDLQFVQSHMRRVAGAADGSTSSDRKKAHPPGYNPHLYPFGAEVDGDHSSDTGQLQ